MSVYTTVSQQQLKDFLALYTLGNLISFKGIKDGIENTNYTVTTTQGNFVLTIFESLTAKELPCYLLLLNHLSQNNFPAPKPQKCIKKQYVNTLIAKPAALFNCLPGHSVESPSPSQCEEIGEYLAKLHECSKKYDFQKQNSKNLEGCQSVFDNIRHALDKDDIKLLDSELKFQATYALPVLPRGLIHADLFKDNVLFNNGRISGVLDFYNACNDYFLFDIAVTCNDWCIDNGIINPQKIKALLSGYAKIRALNDNEKKHLAVFLRLAALRFCLSRREHLLNPKKAELTLVKDPLVFSRLLEYHRANMELYNDSCLPANEY